MSGDIILSQREARALIHAIDCYRSNPPNRDHAAYLAPTERDALTMNIARTYLDFAVRGSEDARGAAGRE